MKYTKLSMTPVEQAQLLVGRGMTGDLDVMVKRLSTVSYYRLSAYWHPFKRPDDQFHAGTHFATVWDTYVFDRRLRLLVLDAIERVEVAVRARLTQAHASVFGPFGYADDATSLFPSEPDERTRLLDRLADETKRSGETFVKHFRTTYGSQHPHLPLWVVSEIMSLGSLLALFRGCDESLRKEVSRTFGVGHRPFNTWLIVMNSIRNICAHHSRLWNKLLGVRPTIPLMKTAVEWHIPVPVPSTHLFGTLTILAHCLYQIAPGSTWAVRLDALFAAHPAIPPGPMGFPPNWRDCPIWARMLALPAAPMPTATPTPTPIGGP